MPPAAIMAAVPIAMGLGAGTVAAATGAGKSTFKGKRFDESPSYDKDRFEVAGNPAGADQLAGKWGGTQFGYADKANDYNNVAEGQRLQADQDHGLALQDRDLALQSRGLMGEDRALGHQARDLALQDRDLAQQSRDLSLADRGLGLQARAQGQEGRSLALGARGQQQGVASLMLDRAQGRNLVADRVAALNRSNLGASMRSAAASARGPAALANAQSDAMAAEAQGIGQINTGQSIAGAQEQLAAEQGAMGAYSTIREGDTGQQGMDLGVRQGDIQQQGTDVAIRQGDLQQQGTDINLRQSDIQQQGMDLGLQQNDISQQQTDIARRAGTIDMRGQSIQGAGSMGQLGLGYGGLENDVRRLEGDLNLGQQRTMSGSEQSRQQIDADIRSGNAKQDMKYVEMIAGGVEGAMKGGMPAGGTPPTGGVPIPGKEDGGPVQAGQPYVVGEAGKEVFVPKQDGVIVPNHALPSSPSGMGGFPRPPENRDVGRGASLAVERRDPADKSINVVQGEANNSEKEAMGSAAAANLGMFLPGGLVPSVMRFGYNAADHALQNRKAEQMRKDQLEAKLKQFPTAPAAPTTPSPSRAEDIQEALAHIGRALRGR